MSARGVRGVWLSPCGEPPGQEGQTALSSPEGWALRRPTKAREMEPFNANENVIASKGDGSELCITWGTQHRLCGHMGEGLGKK